MFYRGLTDAEARLSAKSHGENIMKWEKRSSFFKELLAALGDPIMKTLLGAMTLNLILSFRSRQWFEPVGVAAAVFLASLLSAISEYGSEAAFLKLQREADKKPCRIVRNGVPGIYRWSDVTVGDKVLLQAGEAAPADGIMTEGEIRADQSALNGESREVRKYPGGSRDRDPLSPSCILRGTVITAGEGAMRVTRVGGATVFGEAAKEPAEKSDSPMKTRLTALSKTISAFGYCAAALVFIMTLFKEIALDNGMNVPLMLAEVRNVRRLLTCILDAGTLAISVLVVAVPEGLPMMITVALSRNMAKMARDNVIVKKPVGIETAGSMNILFCDKTGTLTRGKIRVRSFMTPDGRLWPAEKPPEELKSLLPFLCFATSSGKTGGGKTVGGNATDRALCDCALALGLRPPERDGFIPFSSERRFSAARCGKKVFIKGAPETILPKCGVTLEKYKKEAACGRRIVALAEADEMPGRELPAMHLRALAVLEDRLRPETPGAIEEMRRAGIKIVMITGDAPETAGAIARDAGLEPGRIMEGRELDRLSDGEIKALIPSLSVVARAMPSHKKRLVALSMEMGMTAGMTGDGVNDAPALRAADVGFSMGSGTEVAKEAGDIVISDDNVASIARAVLYGRTIFHSIRKFIVFQLTVNLCAVGVSALSPLLGLKAPITVAQMLWINMIMDTLSGLAFAGEPLRRDYMKEAPKSRGEPILNRAMAGEIAVMGLWCLGLSLWFLLSPGVRAFFRPHPDDLYLLTGFFAFFVFSGICAAFSARVPDLRLLGGKNRTFFLIMGVAAAVQTGLIYFGGTLFRTAGLEPGELIFTLVLSLSVILAGSARKLAVKHKKPLTLKKYNNIINLE